MGSASHACIGVASLGLCNYDPAAPAIAYFTIGDAIAALALTLAVQQFLKPVYTLRLNVRRLSLWYIYALCFVGAAFAVIAAFLPNLPFNRSVLPAYPVVWEIAGGFCFFFAYGALAFGSTVPLRVRSGHLDEFARAVAGFLSERDPKDYTGIAHDILRNLPALVRYAAFTEDHWQGMTAFFGFTHRRALQDGNYAASLLRIMSDREFARSLVDGSPWALAITLREMSSSRLFADSAESLIQELARQALLSEKSIMAREVGWRGFSHAPILTEALFSDTFILEHYRPLQMLDVPRSAFVDEGFLERLGSASVNAFEATLEKGAYWQSRHLSDVRRIYERVLQEIRWAGEKTELDFRVAMNATQPVVDIAEKVREHLLNSDRIGGFYLRDVGDRQAESRQTDLIGITARLTADCLDAIAHDFNGADDRFWHFALELWGTIYPRYGPQPSGMDPLQQRVALLLLRTLDSNMIGFYPALTRVLLAVIGPYHSHPHENPRSAAALIESAFYAKMKGLRKLSKEHADRIGDYLPNYVTFDPAANVLTHTYRDGQTRTTNLSLIRPRMPNFAAEAIALQLPPRC